MKRLWIVLATVVIFGFTVLGWLGSRVYQEMPPIPERIVTSERNRREVFANLLVWISGIRDKVL